MWQLSNLALVEALRRHRVEIAGATPRPGLAAEPPRRPAGGAVALRPAAAR